MRPRVRQFVTSLFAAEDFWLIGDQPASVVMDGLDDADDATPDGDAWYGAIVSGVSGNGWVSVYVDDWQDSGFLAKRLSHSLNTPLLEVWVNEDIHWGYTYYENGEVRDRFADDAFQVAETAEEAALYRGQPGGADGGSESAASTVCRHFD